MPHSHTTRNTLNHLLEKRILKGISLEWETAAATLNHSSGILLKKPLFSLHEGSRQLGLWDSAKKEISFSRSFVVNHSWDSITEVLLHEMAHQLTDEGFRVRTESPHGPTFKKACRLLRANPAASGSFPPLTERVLDETGSENDKIMYRIKKLFALAQSSNVHEAEAALAKAHSLIRKYNIEMIETDQQRDYVSICVGTPALRRFRESYALANLITEHYFVFGIWVPSYVIDKEKMGRVLEISGTRKNVKIAAYVYDYITRFIDRSWEGYNRDGKHNRHRKTDYATGIIDGFKSKLRQNTIKNNGEENRMTPVIIIDRQLENYTAWKYPNVRNFRRQATGIDEGIVKDGEKAGRKLVISRGITDSPDKRVKGYLR